jgi:Flp pilus assembly protein TadB
MTRLMANVFVAFSFIVFVATFLAFAVARRSRQREKRSSKRRRLLDEDGKSRSSRRRRGADSDGLYRSSRSKSADRRPRSKSARSSRSKSASTSRRHPEDGTYEPPKRSSSRSGSRRALDDF